MKYSNKALNDENFDDEFEGLMGVIGMPLDVEFEFYEELPSGFSKQDAEDSFGIKLGFDEWHSGRILPDTGEFNLIIQKGQLAYEFANCFLSVYYVESV